MTTQQPSKLSPDDKLLLTLLLQPIKRLSFMGRLKTFLSAGSWQGIGAICGILSLIVATVLTVYIFQITKEQGNANVIALPYAGRLNIGTGEADTIIYSLNVFNIGPATGKDV